MADNLIQQALSRGYSIDEIANKLSEDAGFAPDEIRSRGYSSQEIIGKLGYEMPVQKESMLDKAKTTLGWNSGRDVTVPDSITRDASEEIEEPKQKRNILMENSLMRGQDGMTSAPASDAIKSLPSVQKVSKPALQFERQKESNRKWLDNSKPLVVDQLMRDNNLSADDAELEFTRMRNAGVVPKATETGLREATWGEAFDAGIAKVKPSFDKSMAGLAAMKADMTGDFELANVADALRKEANDQLAAAEGVLAGTSKDSWKKTISDAPASLAQNLPTVIAASALASNPALAGVIGNIGLAGMGMMSGGASYSEGKDAGLNASNNLQQSTLKAMAEVIPEKMSLSVLTNALGKKAAEQAMKDSILQSAKTLGKYIGSEIGTEELTTIAQFGVDKMYSKPDMPMKELVSQMIDTAKATLIQAPILGGAGILSKAAVDNAGRIIDPVGYQLRGFEDAVDRTNFAPLQGGAENFDGYEQRMAEVAANPFGQRLTRIAQAEQTKAAAQQAIATAPTVDAAVDAFNVATAAGSSSMVDQSQLLNDVNEATGGSQRSISELSTLALQQAGEGGNLLESQIPPEDWKLLEDLGLIDDLVTKEGVPYRAANMLALLEERARRHEENQRNKKAVSQEEIDQGIENRARNYDRIADEQDALGELGDAELAAQMRAKAAEIRSRKGKRSDQANDAQVGAEQAAAPEITTQNPKNPQNPQNPQAVPNATAGGDVVTDPLTPITKEIADRVSAKSDAALSLMAKTNTDPVVTEAVKQEQAKRAKPIYQWTDDELSDRLQRADSGESPLSQESRTKIEAELAKRVPAAPKIKRETKLSIGSRPTDAEPITVNNGVVYIGKYPAMDYETEEDITVKDGATDEDIVSALRAGGVIGRNKVFGLVKSEKPAAPKKDRKAVYPESDSALVAIAKLGGMDTQQLLTNGFDQSDISVMSRGRTIGKRAMQTGGKIPKNAGQVGKGSMRAKQVGFNMPIHRNGGMSFDGMREALVQYGYLPEDASVNDAIELLRRELRGEPVYTASAVQAQAEAAEADRQAMMEAEQEANEASGYDELQGTTEERYADALIEELYGEEVAALASGMRVAGLTEEEINAEIEAFNQRTGGQVGAGQSQERSGEGRAEESGTDAEVFGGKESAEPDWLSELFGDSANTPEPAAKPKSKIDLTGLVGALRAFSQKKLDEANDWASRKYKDNKTKINFEGDGPTRNESISVSAANESRRNRTVDALQKQAQMASNLANRIERGFDVQAEIAQAIRDAESDIARDGKPRFGGTRETQVEAYISKSMLGDDLYGYGEGTVANLIRKAYEQPSTISAENEQKSDFSLSGQTNEEAAAEYKQQQAEATKQEAEPPSKNVTVDQVDIFNEQGGLFNSNRDIRYAFAGQSSATADKHALATAQARLSAGEYPETVRKETGWFKGADGKWRYEISDADAIVNFQMLGNLQSGGWSGFRARNISYRKNEDGTYTLEIVPVGAKQTSEIASVTIPESMLNSLVPKDILGKIEREEGGEGFVGDFLEAKEINQEFDFDGFNALPLSDVIDHPALFAAYPALKDVMVQINKKIGRGAQFSEMEMSDGSTVNVITLGALPIKEFKSALMHEIQHGIQTIEGFASGGNEKTAIAAKLSESQRFSVAMNTVGKVAEKYGYKISENQKSAIAEQVALWEDADDAVVAKIQADAGLSDGEMANFFQQDTREIYRRLAGEVEARNTQARLNMTDAERRATPPSQTADVADSDVIVVFNGKEMAFAPIPSNAAPAKLPLPQQTAERLIARELGSTTLAKVLVDSGIVSFANSEEELKKLGGKLMYAKQGQAQDDLFAKDFATKRTTIKREVVVSSKGAKEIIKLGNVASDGRQIAPTVQALENFWDWYGQGPVDEKGRPILLFHSTNGDISEFEVGRETTNNYGFLGNVTTTRAGIFATPAKDFSQEYLRDGSGQNVMPIFMALQNPLGMRDGMNGEDISAIVDASDGEITHRDFYYLDPSKHWELFDDEFGEKFVRAAKAAGFDGAIMIEDSPSGNTSGGETYVAFDSTSIKSATGNNGAFDGSNPDIRKSQQQQILGATLPDGRIILNLGALTEQNFAGVFKHEGFHSSVRELVGEETWNQLMSQLEMNLKAAKGNDWVTRANAAIPADTKASDRTEELAAYAIEQTTNGAKVPNFIKRWVDSLLSAIRTALIRGMGGEKAKLWAMKHLKPQDLANLAIAGLKAKARNELASQGRAAMAYSAKDLDGGNNGKGRGFWDVLRARGEGFRGVYPGSTVQALSVRKRSRKAAANLGRYREDDSTTVIRWNDKVAGFDGYYSFGVPYNGAFATYFVPANRFTDIDDALLSDDFLRENAFFSIGFSFKPDGYELHVSDPVNGSSIFNEMLADGRLKPTEDYSSDGSHHYHAVQFDDKRDLPMLMSEAVRRLAIHIGKAPERVYSNGRDTGVNKERPRDYNADQVEAKFSTAFGPESQHRTPLGDVTEIEVDGVKRPALNSNGKPIHWSREGVENFWRWFGDSRVVDEQGRPLVVYHGTAQKFTEFSVTSDVGYHFGDKSAAIERMSKMGRADVEIDDVSPSNIDLDSARVKSGDASNSKVEQVYSLLLRKLDIPRNDLLDQLAGMSDAELDQTIVEYGQQKDSASFERRAARGSQNPGFAVKVNGETVGTFATEKEAKKEAARLRKEMNEPMPVYLLIKNPIELPDLGVWPAQEIAKESGFNANEMRQVYEAGDESAQYKVVRQILITNGYDGIAYENAVENTGSTSLIAFSPTQIKSATGNTGDFDGSNPDIRYSKASPAQPAPLPEETKARAVQRKIQDKFNRFTVIKDWLKSQGIQLSEQADVYKAEERMHSRFANKVEDFRTKLVEPLIKKIQAAGFSMDDVSLFLHAQHAEERNNQIAKINPKVTDGSGMSTADANKVLAAAPAELKALANEFRQITEMTKQTLLDAGIISQDMVNAWEGAYSNYVPLKGGPDEKAKSGTGKGLHVNGKMKRALGHGKRKGGEWIAENILADYERAVMLAEKNRVGHHLVRMALEARRDDLITLNKPEKRAVLFNSGAFVVMDGSVQVAAFNKKEDAKLFVAKRSGSGLNNLSIKFSHDPQVVYLASEMLEDNEANVYVNGHAIRVQINDELLAREYKSLGAEALWAGMEAGRMLNGYLSKAYTGYNPEFILTNIVRDFTTGLINITGEEGALFAAKAAKNYVSSFGSLLKYAVSGKENQWIKDYRDDGGNTGAAYLSDLERLGKEIKTEYDSYKGVIENLKARDGAGAARAAGRNLFNVSLKWIEHLNQAGENAMRLSIYRAAIESGKTRAEAASLAKNSTVNFNRRGELGANINALYLFFNAGVQGTSALAHAHFKGKHKYQAWALSSGMIGLGFIAAAAFGGGDEDDYDRELSDYDKSRNLVIRAGDSWVKIPVPYGYGFFYNLGRHLADAERKGEWNKMPWHLASDFVGEFTPFSGVVAGKEPDIRQGIYALPTAFQIPGAVAVNRTGMGSPIFPENKFDENQPDNLKMWRNTKGTLADDLAQVLDKAGLQVSPETLKYLGRTATGGSGAFVGSVFDAGKLTLEGADIETKEMPFVRKFVKEGSVSDYRSAFYEAKSEASKAADDFARAKKMGDMMSAKRLEKDDAELIAMDKYADSLSKMLKAKRDTQDVVKQDEKLTVAEKRLKLKALELEEQKVYDRYLDIFKQRTKERRERLDKAA